MGVRCIDIRCETEGKRGKMKCREAEYVTRREDREGQYVRERVS